MSWYETQCYCRKNYTDLASIRAQQQNKDVQREGSKSSMSFWIGLLRDDWEWSDGGCSAYRNWREGDPLPSGTYAMLFQAQWDELHFSLCYQSKSWFYNEQTLQWSELLISLETLNHPSWLFISNSVSPCLWWAGRERWNTVMMGTELEFCPSTQLLNRKRWSTSSDGGVSLQGLCGWGRHGSLRDNGAEWERQDLHCLTVLETHTGEVAPEYQLNFAKLQVIYKVKSP